MGLPMGNRGNSDHVNEEQCDSTGKFTHSARNSLLQDGIN